MFALFPKLYRKFFPLAAKREKRRRGGRYAPRPTLERLEDRVVPATDVFTAPAGGGNWMNNNLWSLGALPGSSDVAVISSGSLCVLNDPNPQTVAGLTVNGQLNLGSKLSVTTGSTATGSTFNEGTGGDLDVISSMDFQGNGVIQGRIDTGSSLNFDYFSAMTLAAGTSIIGGGFMNVSGPLTITGALNPDATISLNNDGGNTTNGSIAGGGSLEVGHDMTWTGGTIALTGGTTIDSSGSLDVTGSDTKFLGALLTNESMLCTFEGTGYFMMNASGGSTGGTIDNAAGQMTVSQPNFLTTGTSGATITNEALGTFKETGDTTITGVTLNNEGKLNIDSGASLTLSFAAPMSSHALDGTLQLDGDLILLSAVTAPTGLDVAPGSGHVKIGDGTTTGSLTVSSGNYLELFGDLELTKTGTLSGGELDNNGDLILDVGSATDLGSYVQSTTGTLDIHAAQPPMSFPVSATLTVAGSAQLSGVLNLDPDDGYSPTSGTKFAVLKAGSIADHFDTTPDGWTTSYSSTEVDITKN